MFGSSLVNGHDNVGRRVRGTLNRGQNTRKMLSFNSPTSKLSNDTPYAYSTAKNEIPIFRAIRGQ